MPPKGNIIPVAVRLARKTDTHGPLPLSFPEWGNCWVWTGGLRGNGYAAIGAGGAGARNLLIHRVAWGIADGAMPPDGLVVGHTCDVRTCVRNDTKGTYEVNGVSYPRWGHLFLCPASVNYDDMMQKGRQSRSANVDPATRPRGETHGMAILTADDVRQIRSLYKRGNGPMLARQFNVKQATISAIVCRRLWKHVP